MDQQVKSVGLILFNVDQIKTNVLHSCSKIGQVFLRMLKKLSIRQFENSVLTYQCLAEPIFSANGWFNDLR